MNNNCQIYFTFSVQNTVITGKKCDTKEPEVKHLLSLDTCGLAKVQKKYEWCN